MTRRSRPITAERQEDSIGDGASQKFAEWCAECDDPVEVVGGEIWASQLSVSALAADLYHAYNAIAGGNRGADDFLDGLGGLGGKPYAFKNAGVFHGGEIVDNFRPVLPGGTRRERGLAGEWNEADVFERFGDDEVQVVPAIGNGEDGDFVGADGKTLRDAFRDGGERNLRRRICFRFQRFRKALQLCYETHVLSRKRACATLWPGERARAEIGTQG